MNLVFDIETDGFIDVLTTIHSLVTVDIDTKEMKSYADRDGYLPISAGIKALEEADLIVAHNALCFDVPVIKKLYPDTIFKKVRDTLTMSRLIFSDMYDQDIKAPYKGIMFAKKLIGRHSLESWGIRLKAYKQSFGKTTDWKEWSVEMQQYCEQDTAVLLELWKHLSSIGYSEEAIELEHRFQEIIYQQEVNGVPFDAVKASQLYYNLLTEKNDLERSILEVVPSSKKTVVFLPKRDDKVKGYTKGVPYLKEKEIPFNPGSRQQVIQFLKTKYNWTPVDFTDKGNPSIDSDVLSKLKYKEAALFSKYYDVTKILGRLMNKDGEGWLTQHKDGRIHGRMLTNGAVTGRCTHQIISNIPKVTSYKGKECRELFTSGSMVMVGADAAQLELRMLAHYMAIWDKGAYAKEVDEGDVHTRNQHAAGLPTRDDAKTFIYALMYGAGDQKLGAIVYPEATEEIQKSVGKELRTKFKLAIPAYDVLLHQVRLASKKKLYLKGLDGRKLLVRGEHMALNTLLQGAGAIIMKKATCIMWDLFERNGLSSVVKQAINYHDENQVLCPEDHAETVGILMIKSITLAGEYFKLSCPLRGEYKIGKNWAETH